MTSQLAAQRIVAPALSALMLWTGSALGQTADANETLRVFLDCRFCQSDHFRREVAWVNYVRDRTDADVHVLGTVQGSGGGSEFAYHFIGLGEYAGREDTLRYRSSSTDTDDERRDGLTRTFAIGILRYSAEAGATEGITFRYRQPDTRRVARPEDDPWNFWVFSVRAGGNVRGESQETRISVDGRATANRVTEDWKVALLATGRYSRTETELTDTTFINTSRNWRTEGTVVRSLGDHWSTGGQVELSSSTFSNQDFRARTAAALEYSLFPYAESTRRQVTVLYTLGVVYFDWEELTVFGQLEELRVEQDLEISVEALQPWGSVGGSVEGHQFLHDLSLHSLEFRGGFDFRVLRGLDLGIRGSVARIKDQISLLGAELSNEDILVRRRQRGTDFRYSLSFNITYRFGSIFNNVVNPRMRF